MLTKSVPREDRTAPELRGMPPGISLYAKLLLLLTAFALFFPAELGYAGLYPSRAKLWSPDFDRFGDFWHYRVLLGSLHQAVFFTAPDRFAYPAPCALLFQGLYRLGPRPHVSFNLLLWGIEAGSAALLLRALRRRGLRPGAATALVLLMALSSHPWHMLYDRGNIELFVYLFLALGVWAWLRERPELAAALWGCAGSLKLYPLLLLAIFLRRGRWRSFAVGLGTCAAVLLFSFWYVGPTIGMAARGTVQGLRGFVGTYGAHSRSNELVYDHSLLAGLKMVAERMFGAGGSQARLSHAYEAMVLLVGPVAFLWWRRHAPEVNQLCLLLVCMVLLPPVSYDYTLIHVYLVIGIVLCAYVGAARRGMPFPGATRYALCFAVVCTAEMWIELWGWEPNGMLKAVALVTVGSLLVRYPLVRAGAALGTDRPESMQLECA